METIKHECIENRAVKPSIQTHSKYFILTANFNMSDV